MRDRQWLFCLAAAVVVALLAPPSAEAATYVTSAVRGGTGVTCPPPSVYDPVIVPFDEDVDYWLDRCHDAVLVPTWMKGMDLVKIRQDDKGIGANFRLTMEVNGPCYVFLLIDRRFGYSANQNALAWVRRDGFAQTGWTVGIDENGGHTLSGCDAPTFNCANDGTLNNMFLVFQKKIDAAGTVVLEGQPNSNSMYAVVVGGTAAPGGYPLAPDGWIQAQAWNFLFLDTEATEFEDPNGDAPCNPNDTADPADVLQPIPGYAGRIDANWVAPLNVGTESPTGGDDWDIDFRGTGGAAQAEAWELPSVGAKPTWVNFDWMLDTFGYSYRLNQDAVDLDGIVQDTISISATDGSLSPYSRIDAAAPWTIQVTKAGHGLAVGDILAVFMGSDGDVNGRKTVSAVIDGDNFQYQNSADPSASGTLNFAKTSPNGPGVIWDGMLTIATTYVENLTGKDLAVQFCGSSDDSLQTWVNDVVVTNAGVCRGTAGNCSEIAYTFLPPGVSKISALVWEGGGGHGLRFGIILGDGRVRDDDPRLRLLGPVGAGQTQPAASPEIADEVNRRGFITPRGWNFLFTLQNPFGAAPSDPLELYRNWLAPRDIGREDPKAGDVWDDFLGQNLSAQMYLGGLVGAPTWLSYDLIAEALGIPVTAIPAVNDELFDFNWLADWLSDAVIGPNFTGGRILQDNVFAVATTYVRNNTGAPLPVDVYTSSDDSIGVMVNCNLVTLVSRPRGSTGNGIGASEVNPAVLLPGVNKITMFVWEGGGGFNGKVGLRRPGEGYFLNGSDETYVTFLGTGVGDDTAVTNLDGFCLDRVVEETERNKRNIGEAKVSLQATGDAGADVVVTDIVYGANIGSISVPETSANCVVTDVLETVYVNRSSTGQDIQNGGDICNFTYAPVTGDFDISIAIVSYEHNPGTGNWGKYGLMARELEESQCGRMASVIRVGPGNWGDGPRAARTTANLPANCGSRGYGETGWAPNSSHKQNPAGTAMRLKRVGNNISMYSADTIPLAPTDDSQWSLIETRGYTGGGALAATVYVGLANSEHGDGGAGTQTIRYFMLNGPEPTTQRVLGADAALGSWETLPNTLVGKAITCAGPGDSFAGDYTLAGIEKGSIFIQSSRGAQVNQKVTRVDFARGTGPVGPFDGSVELGDGQGSLVDNGDDSYTMTMLGGDIWDGGDHGYFAYKEVTGDFQVTMRITERTNPGPDRWGKHGLMARYTFDFDSKMTIGATHFPYGVGSPGQIGDTPRHMARWRHRVAGSCQEQRPAPRTFEDPAWVAGGAVPAELTEFPGWLRLTRIGNHLYTELSDLDENGDPKDWVYLGGDTHKFRPETLLVGLGGCSHVWDRFAEVTFDNVTYGPAPALDAFTTTVGDPVFDEDFASGEIFGNKFKGGGGLFEAAIINERLRVIQDGVADVANAVYFDLAGANLGDTGFIAEFDMYFEKAGIGTGDVNPADGATFQVYQGSDSLALTGTPFWTGGAMGWHRGWDTNQQPVQARKSFAVEFDCWDNQDKWYGADWNDNFGWGGNDFWAGGAFDGQYHIGLDVHETAQSVMTSYEYGNVSPDTSNGFDALPNPYDVDGMHVEVIYTAPTNRIEVFVTGKYLGGDPYPRTKVIDGVGPNLKGDIFVGFSGATGGATMTVDFDNLLVTSLCTELPDEVTIDGLATGEAGTPVVLTAIASGVEGTAAYAWELVSGAATLTAVDGRPDQISVNASAAGDVVVKVTMTDGACAGGDSDEITIAFSAPPGGIQKPGDSNQDGKLDISDPVDILGYLFLGLKDRLPCGDGEIGDPANLALLDVNGDGGIDLSDPVYILNFLFTGGTLPANCFGDEQCPCVRIPGCPDNAGKGDCP